MKQSSTDPLKKKLIQARLPFQILSPGVKSSIAPEPRKRKASETLGDDVQASEITEVKENQVTPVEKKLKIGNNNAVEIAEDENTTKSNKRIENGEEKMEVEEEEKTKISKTAASSKPSSKGKTSTKKSKNVGKNIKKTSNSMKVKGKISPSMKKKDNKTDNSKSLVLDFVDLTDSPVKADHASEKSLPMLDAQKSNLESPLESTKENSDNQEDKLDQNVVEESNRKRKRKEQDKAIEKELKIDNSQEKPESNQNNKIIEKDERFPVTLNKKIKEKVVELPNTAEKINDNSSKPSDTLSNNSKTDIDKIKEGTSIDTVTNESSHENPSESSSNVQLKATSENVCNISNEDTRSDHKKEQSSRLLEPKTPSRKSQSSVNDSSTPSLNDSPRSLDVSLSSESSTPTAISAAPSLSKKRPSLTPRRLTPKQLMKMKEKEVKKKERERIKQEKDKKREEEKEEKQRLKLEKEEERLKQKQEKEEEKRKEKEEKERKKQAEILQKNEEKRLKDEEKRLKEEEKKVKDEERKKKDEDEKKKREEKKLKEEQKEAEKRKSAQAFASFFLKSEVKVASVDEVYESKPQESNFRPFEVKNDMRLAPLVRNQLTHDRKQVLDSLFVDEPRKCARTLYIQELREPSYVKRGEGKTWPAPDETDDDVVIIESEKPNGEIEVEIKESEKKPEKKKHRAKLLQFHGNRRPPYWGTWRKKSKFIRPRAPLNEDKTMFEYDVDSDDEWEEPGEGESLQGSEDEESQDEQYEEDNDMFVPHGYLSDEEGQDEFDSKSPEAMKAKLKFLQLEFEAERNEKQEKLKPRLIGCVWFCNSDSDLIGQSHITELFLSRRAVWEGPLPLKMAPPATTSPSTPSNTGDTSERGAKKKLVPDSMMPTIIKTIHGSRKKLKRLLAELQESCEAGLRPSKRCLADRIREIASWTSREETGHYCWLVKEDVRQAHDLMDLQIKPLTPSKPPATPKSNITKFTKVLTTDERLRLLSTPKESNKSPTEGAKQCVAGSKTPNVASTPAKAGPVVKKRVSLTTLGPVQSTNTMRHFVSLKSEGPKCQTNETANKEEKVKKRITPITLATTVAKPPSVSPSTDDCVVLSD